MVMLNRAFLNALFVTTIVINITQCSARSLRDPSGGGDNSLPPTQVRSADFVQTSLALSTLHLGGGRICMRIHLLITLQICMQVHQSTSDPKEQLEILSMHRIGICQIGKQMRTPVICHLT